MTQNFSKPPTITVRDFPRDKQKRIQALAKHSGKSMNGFICDILSDVAANYEVKELEYKYAELQKQTIEVLKMNTAQLEKNQQLINYVLGED